MLPRTWRRKVSRKPRRFSRKSFSKTKPTIPPPVIPFSNPTLPTTSSHSLSTSPFSNLLSLPSAHASFPHRTHFFPLSNPIFCRLESGPARFHDGYSKLRTWTYSSLDLYKVTRAFSLSFIRFFFFLFGSFLSRLSAYCCSTSCFACFIPSLSTALWTSWRKDMFRKVICRVLNGGACAMPQVFCFLLVCSCVCVWL